MIHINFQTDDLTTSEAVALVVFLEHLKGITKTTETVVTQTVPTEDEVKAAFERATLVPEPAAAPVAEEPKPRKRNAREKKPEVATEQVDPQSSSSAPSQPEASSQPSGSESESKTTETLSSSSAPSAPASDASAPTEAELRNALKVYTGKHDVHQGLELLKDFGCQRISDMAKLPAKDQHEFIRLAHNA